MTDHLDASDIPASPDWEAIARLSAGENEQRNDAEIRRTIALDPRRAELFGVLSSIGKMPDPVAPTAAEVEQALQIVMSRRADIAPAALAPVISLDAYRTARTARTAGLMRIAAGVVVAVSAGALWRTTGSAGGNTTAMHYTSEVGAIKQVTLSDGSNIILAPGSTMHVEAGFGDKRRELTLTGEAKFTVVHNSDAPFVVRTANATFTDVGTVFTVQSDAGDGSRIAVSEGAVAVRGKHSPSSILLKAGDRAVVKIAGEVAVEASSVGESDLAWTSGRLIFRDASIADVSAELRRWYGVELLVDSSLASRRLTATFDNAATTSRSDVGRVVAAALGGGLRDEGDTLRIVPAAPAKSVR